MWLHLTLAYQHSNWHLRGDQVTWLVQQVPKDSTHTGEVTVGLADGTKQDVVGSVDEIRNSLQTMTLPLDRLTQIATTLQDLTICLEQASALKP